MLLSQALIANKIRTFSSGSASAKNFDILIKKQKTKVHHDRCKQQRNPLRNRNGYMYLSPSDFSLVEKMVQVLLNQSENVVKQIQSKREKKVKGQGELNAL